MVAGELIGTDQNSYIVTCLEKRIHSLRQNSELHHLLSDLIIHIQRLHKQNQFERADLVLLPQLRAPSQK